MRLTLSYDYKGNFVPSPFQVTILDDSVTIEEIAQQIYDVAQHAVTYEGRYLAGSAADAERHRH